MKGITQSYDIYSSILLKPFRPTIQYLRKEKLNAMERQLSESDKDPLETEDQNIFQDSVERPIKFDFYQKDLENEHNNEANTRYGD